MDANGSPEYVLTWKHWDMESGQQICALRGRARREKDGLCIKVRILGGALETIGEKHGSELLSAHLISDSGCSGWPTPQARDHFPPHKPEYIAEKKQQGHGMANLNDVVILAGWATPTSSMKVRSQEFMEGREPHPHEFAGWPTPMAGTPAKNGNNEAGNTDSSRKTVALLVAGWSTPTVPRKNGSDQSAFRWNPNKKQDDPVMQMLGRTQSLSDVPMENRGVLNPEFTRWLMGYPDAWGFCGATAMQLSRKSRRSSSKRSSKRKKKSKSPVSKEVENQMQTAATPETEAPTADSMDDFFMEPAIARPEPSANLTNQDCVAGMRDLPPDSIDLIVTSIPFEELFTYSGKLEDVGNNGSTIDIKTGRFALNLRFVIDAMFHALRPGCNACIHIQQLLAYKVQHGFMGRRDFRGAVIDLYRAGEFNFVGEFCIPKNPQIIAQRLSLHSLQFKTGKARTATKLAPCFNDYVLIFQKPGDTPNPVRCLQDKTENPGGWVGTDEWVRWASGVWDDIQETDVLDGWRAAREHDEEKHVCPLQLSLIQRLVRLYTNPICVQQDVTVLDPFMGIGSTAYVCLGGHTNDGRLSPEDPDHRRNVVGFELKESYFDQSQRNVEKVRKDVAATGKNDPQKKLYNEQG